MKKGREGKTRLGFVGIVLLSMKAPQVFPCQTLHLLLAGVAPILLSIAGKACRKVVQEMGVQNKSGLGQKPE